MKELMIAGTVVLLIIFIAGIRWYVKRTIRQQIADYQDDLLEKHCEEVENMYRNATDGKQPQRLSLPNLDEPS